MQEEFRPFPERTEELAAIVIDAALSVRRAFGPGLLESVYETCLCHELSKRGVPFQRQVSLPVVSDSIRLDAGLRLDVLVGGRVVAELKSVEKLTSLHNAQLLTYLKLSQLRLGLLINFNVRLLKDGLKRLVN